MPAEMKICDIINTYHSNSIIFPEGEEGSYHLVVGVKHIGVTSFFDNNRPCPIFSGEITIYEGDNLIISFKINSNVTTSCNWLEDYNLDGYILTWQNEKWSKDLIPGKEYQFTIRLDDKCEKCESLWLNYYILKRIREVVEDDR